jgi:hypothetical protein
LRESFEGAGVQAAGATRKRPKTLIKPTAARKQVGFKAKPQETDEQLVPQTLPPLGA